MINLDLSEKTALICGASQGIGLASAHELANLGCHIIALARDKKALQKACDALPTPNQQQHDLVCADLLDLENLEQRIQAHIKEHGPIDILINNTGGPKPGPITEAKLIDFENAFTMHLKASVLLTQLVLPGMKQKNYGRIINVISTSIKSPIENLGVSNTVRWAVAGWSKTLSYEVAKFGITVNDVLPGYINTQRLNDVLLHQAHSTHTSLDTVRQRTMDSIPAGRIGEPEEIARVIAFLASPAASYVNGVALPVDGGRTRVL